jgi:hypothetical protein
MRRRCDDKADCQDGSDEVNCGKEPREGRSTIIRNFI